MNNDILGRFNSFLKENREKSNELYIINEAEKLISDTKKIAIDTLNRFFDKLNIDKSLYEYLDKIEIKIDNLVIDDDSAYFPKNNLIVINKSFLINNLENINNLNKNENISIEGNFKNMHAFSMHVIQLLIHEYLHAIRRETLLSNTSNEEKYKNCGVEEILCESIAYLIVLSEIDSDKNINYEEISKKITKENGYKSSDIIGFNLIKSMKDNLLKWFLTCQNYEFLNNKFNDNYDELIIYFFKLYDSERRNNENKDAFNSINDIVNKRRH